MKKILVSSVLIVCVFFLVASGAVVDQSSSTVRAGIRKIAWKILGHPLSTDQTHVQFKAVVDSGMPDAKFVMFGDSLTQYGNWAALIGRSDILNFGLAGDTTDGMLDRLKSMDLSQKSVLVMGGVNDVLNGVQVDDIAGNLEEIVTILHKNGNTVYLQSTIYTRRAELNVVIDDLIDSEREICSDGKCTFVDVNTAVSAGKPLADDNSVDVVHLNYGGYLLWRDAIGSVFASDGPA